MRIFLNTVMMHWKGLPCTCIFYHLRSSALWVDVVGALLTGTFKKYVFQQYAISPLPEPFWAPNDPQKSYILLGA